MYVCIYIYILTYIHAYIYIYIEREIDIYIYIYIHKGVRGGHERLLGGGRGAAEGPALGRVLPGRCELPEGLLTITLLVILMFSSNADDDNSDVRSNSTPRATRRSAPRPSSQLIDG